jgi:hypothetical protein
MTTNLHDKMLAAIDAYFSASDGTEAEVAENLLLDVRDEINKQQSKAQPAPVQEPVDWQFFDKGCWWNSDHRIKNQKKDMELAGYKTRDLYTTPPAAQKPWVGLTKDDVESWDLPVNPTVFEFAQFIEAKLREKNAALPPMHASGLVAIKTLLERDPEAHAALVIDMIDEMLGENT